MQRVALITGGGRGIGYAIAVSLAKEGMAPVIMDVHPEEQMTEPMARLGQIGVPSLYCRGDVTRREDRLRILECIEQKFGGLHVLINNAGVAPLERIDILEATEESYERVMRINLQGPYFLTQAAAKRMVLHKQALPDAACCIVNISSISAYFASPSRGEYCISKAGVTMATKLWAVRLSEYGIPVYEVDPGIILTDMNRKIKDKYDRLFAEGLALQPRLGTPEDVGKAVAVLVRGDLNYSTGQVIRVDGGLAVQRLYT